MSLGQVPEAVTGGLTPTTQILEAIGKASTKIEELAGEMVKAKDEDTARWQQLAEARAAEAQTLTSLQEQFAKAKREEETAAAVAAVGEMRAQLATMRAPSKALTIGAGRVNRDGYVPGTFIGSIADLMSRDPDLYRASKAVLESFTEHEEAWGKATLGTTDATGGWIIPNAVVEDIIVPAQVDNIYRELMTVIPGVTGAAVDLPFRSAARSRAVIAPIGDTKENSNLAYNGYTATMYTLARIYDISNQFLRQSRGAAERDVLSELAAAFTAGEAFYVREGTGSSQPYGYSPALTNGPSTFRTTGPSVSDSTVAGSIAACIAMAAGALASRGVKPTAAVLAGAAYWQMLRQGSDSAGFWFATQERSPASIRPGTLISPFGIPVFADAQASLEGTAAVIDDLVVADWKRFKIFFGESYRVDSSDQAGERWDKNLTGFRGEEEMGFDARPAVYAGYAQMITDVIP